MKYEKPALRLEEQLALLVGRGLLVGDQAFAILSLKNINYYRLSAYCKPFHDGERFRDRVSFEDISRLYEFDCRFRQLAFEATEPLEVALRATVTAHIARDVGPFGHTKPGSFAPWFRHDEFMQNLRDAEAKSHELFVKHYRRKYTLEPELPIWMATELLTFGDISYLFSALRPAVKTEISKRFNVPQEFFVSWVHTISYVRNICAHHGRLWNRVMAVTPKLPAKGQRYWLFRIPVNNRVYCFLVIAAHCLKCLGVGSGWSRKVVELIESNPQIDIAAMGFPNDWRDLGPWR